MWSNNCVAIIKQFILSVITYMQSYHSTVIYLSCYCDTIYSWLFVAKPTYYYANFLLC